MIPSTRKLTRRNRLPPGSEPSIFAVFSGCEDHTEGCVDRVFHAVPIVLEPFLKKDHQPFGNPFDTLAS